MTRSFILLFAILGSTLPAAAGQIEVTAPWLRATPRGAPVAGGYATIVNHGATPDRLIGASIPMAPNGEVHSMTMANGIMHMARLADGLAIAPGATVTLEPGGNHLMFLKPTAQLKEGEHVTGSLSFAKAGTIDVTFAVAGMAARTAPGAAAAPAAMSGTEMKGAEMKGMDMKGMGMKGMGMKGMH